MSVCRVAADDAINVYCRHALISLRIIFVYILYPLLTWTIPNSLLESIYFYINIVFQD